MKGLKMFQGIKNVITWLPVIWNDRQFDQNYLLKVMEKKLELMEKFFDKDSVVLNADRTAKQLRVAKSLIKRLYEDKYDDPAHDYLEKKWGKFNLFFGRDGIKRQKVKTPEDEKEYIEDVNRVMGEAEKRRTQDKEYFCKLLLKHLDEWWD